MEAKNIRSKRAKDKLLLNEMKKRKATCVKKMKKISDRIAILEAYLKQPESKKTDLQTYLRKRGINYKEFFAPMGYYSGAGKVVSKDAENERLEYWKGMVYNAQAGYYTPKKNIVTNDDHNRVIKSQLGMTWNPKVGYYVPTTAYSSSSFSRSEKNGDSGMDIMGGLRTQDFGALNSYSKEGEIFTGFVKELLEEEFDNVTEEFDMIEGSENILKQRLSYSSAEGDSDTTTSDEPKSKKEKRKEKKAERKEDRKERKETRQEFREGKKECKEKYQKGEISKEEYEKCLKAERKEKKEKLKEQGGTFVGRLVRGFSTITPITIASRVGAQKLIETNAFAFASRLAPALLPEAEAKEKFKPEAIEKSKKAWQKIKNAWFLLGGKEDKLKISIITGYRKKPTKVSKKSSFEGNDYVIEIREAELFSQFSEPATLIASISGGVATLTGLLATINKMAVERNPYKKGKAPEGFEQDLNEMGQDPTPDKNDPVYDPNTGKWIEPTTGREVDPTTGEYKDTIFGINKWLAIGLGVGALVGIYYLTKSKK